MIGEEGKSGGLIAYGSFAGIAVSIFFSAMWVAAVAVHGSWRFGLDTLSELGGDVPSRWIFNSGAIVSGLLSVLFALALASYLSPRKLGILGSYIFIVASIGLIAVGVFPIDTGDPHTIASIFFFLAAAIAAFILLHPLAGAAGIAGIPFIATIVLIVVSVSFIAFTSVPLAEAITVIGLLIWVAIMSIWMMLSRKSESRGNFENAHEENKS